MHAASQHNVGHSPGFGHAYPVTTFLEADAMMISYPTDDDRTFLEPNPLFQQLDAVKNGNYLRLDQAESAALGFPSALSISTRTRCWPVRATPRPSWPAVDGDPATKPPS
ncbi:MAG: hypothetical protein ACRDST_11390 [Pseudonocardiaceae bacterium]